MRPPVIDSTHRQMSAGPTREPFVARIMPKSLRVANCNRHLAPEIGHLQVASDVAATSYRVPSLMSVDPDQPLRPLFPRSPMVMLFVQVDSNPA